MNQNRIAIVSSLLFCLLMVAFPSISVAGAKNALNLWANTALPALLPFFICANFMVAMRIPETLGKAMESVIGKFFRTPGEAAFVFIMSITSGYPVGVKLTSDLRKSGRLSRVQGERALSFCSTSGPLFMLGAVGAGMFADPRVGWVIALSHYTGAITNGLLYGRLFRERERELADEGWMRSVGRSRNSRSFQNPMEFLTEAILDAVKTLFIIGGYMVLFLILVEALRTMALGESPLLFGFFEMTVGAQTVSAMKGITLSQACVLCAAIISWGGLSVQAQSISFLAGTDLRISRYLLTKATHMLFAGLWAIPFSRLLLDESVSAWSQAGELWQQGQNHFLYHFLFSSGMLILVFVAFCALSMLSVVMNENKTEAEKLRRLHKKEWKQEQRRQKELETAKKAEERERQREIREKEKEEHREIKKREYEERQKRKKEKKSDQREKRQGKREEKRKRKEKEQGEVEID